MKSATNYDQLFQRSLALDEEKPCCTFMNRTVQYFLLQIFVSVVTNFVGNMITIISGPHSMKL